jgi:hypothetical protein
MSHSMSQFAPPRSMDTFSADIARKLFPSDFADLSQRSSS